MKTEKKGHTSFVKKDIGWVYCRRSATKRVRSDLFEEKLLPQTFTKLFFVPSSFKARVFTNAAPKSLLARVESTLKATEKRKPNNFGETLVDAKAKLWYVHQKRNKALDALQRLICHFLTVCIDENRQRKGN